MNHRPALALLVAVNVALLAAAQGCAAWSKIEPQVPVIAEDTALCVLAHAEDAFPAIVVECAVPDAVIPLAQDLLAAHRAQVAKAVAGALLDASRAHAAPASSGGRP